MEQKKTLYPIKFIPATEQHRWGKETHMIADLGIVDTEAGNGWLAGNTISDIMETYIERVVGEDVYNYYGRQFPVSVSVLDIDGDMPVACHPDDESAGQRYDALGKNTLWYILEASGNAMIYFGFKNGMSATELYERCLDGSIRDALTPVKPGKGDWLNIRPGTVYSASGRLRILSISEASAITFILHDPDGKPEDSHVEDAIDLIDYMPADMDKYHRATASPQPGVLLSSPEFTVARMEVHEPAKVTSGHSFTIYSCIGGGLAVQTAAKDDRGEKHTESYPLEDGETMLVPADIDEFFLVSTGRDTVVLETIVEKREEVDGYIDPDTEPFLEGEDYGGVEDGDTDDDIEADGDDRQESSGKNAGKAADIRRFFN